MLSVQISRGSPADEGDGVGELNLIDLAGSEKVSKTGSSGETLEEAAWPYGGLDALLLEYCRHRPEKELLQRAV